MIICVLSLFTRQMATLSVQLYPNEHTVQRAVIIGRNRLRVYRVVSVAATRRRAQHLEPADDPHSDRPVVGGTARLRGGAGLVEGGGGEAVRLCSRLLRLVRGDRPVARGHPQWAPAVRAQAAARPFRRRFVVPHTVFASCANNLPMK